MMKTFTEHLYWNPIPPSRAPDAAQRPLLFENRRNDQADKQTTET